DQDDLDLRVVEAHVLGCGGPAPAAADHDHSPPALGRDVALHRARASGGGPPGERAEAEPGRPQECSASECMHRCLRSGVWEKLGSRPGSRRIYRATRNAVKRVGTGAPLSGARPSAPGFPPDPRAGATTVART